MYSPSLLRIALPSYFLMYLYKYIRGREGAPQAKRVWGRDGRGKSRFAGSNHPSLEQVGDIYEALRRARSLCMLAGVLGAPERLSESRTRRLSAAPKGLEGKPRKTASRESFAGGVGIPPVEGRGERGAAGTCYPQGYRPIRPWQPIGNLGRVRATPFGFEGLLRLRPGGTP